ncbi:hypothetical protein F5Y05DRAFT_416228 [Hypoxylon sp. FL0543]|nr:hypothetical protein F5Y05DRAFT_416228 [Hypoxylon sp. FL0543]
MLRERLNDAAIALYRVFSRAGVSFGIFGGHAIQVFGSPRSTKDIDCLARITKLQVIQLFHEQEGFRVVSQVRDDYALLFWFDPAKKHNPVVVEIFCEQFPGFVHSMESAPCSLISIKGHSLGHGVSSFLRPFYIFKGKLHAAAHRAKFLDSADLRALANQHEDDIKPFVDQLNLETIGLAIRRHVELELLFRRLGVDLSEAKQAAKYTSLSDEEAVPAGAVQSGLLA